MLRTRLWMGFTLALALVAALWIDEQITPRLPDWCPPYPLWLVIAVTGVTVAGRELLHLFERRGIRPSRPLSYAGLVGVTLANWAPWLAKSSGSAGQLAWPFGAVCLFGMLVLVREAIVFREPGQAIATASGGLLLVFYVGVLGSLLIELRWLNFGWAALATQVAAAKCGDTAAYFGGRAFGRHKLCPWLSPNKTVEGGVAGVLGSVFGTVAAVAVVQSVTGVTAFSWPVACLFGLTVGPLAQVGDLIESLIKRDCHQKDASDVLPGFGGILDVLDSLFFSAPLAFVFWTVLGPGWGGGLAAGRP